MMRYGHTIFPSQSKLPQAFAGSAEPTIDLLDAIRSAEPTVNLLDAKRSAEPTVNLLDAGRDSLRGR